jgi:hypothetical protein
MHEPQVTSLDVDMKEEEKKPVTRSSRRESDVRPLPGVNEPEFDKLLRVDLDFARRVAKQALSEI